MTLVQGRQGYLGLGVETTPGTSVPATTTIPFVVNTLLGKHQPDKDISARASRAINANSVVGKQWGEGDVEVNVDTIQIGYFLKLATGTEIVNTVVASQVFDHLFFTTVSGNTPKTASLYNYQGVDTQLFASMAVDKTEFSVKDSLMTAKTTLKGFFPTSGAYTSTTVSGTLVNFAGYTAKLGSTLVAANAASASPLTDFNLIINNNADVIFESGKSTASRVFWKGLEVTGSFMRYFESTTDRDNYLNLSKQALVITASGNSLPGGNQEQITFNIAKMAYVDQSFDTGLENFFAVKTSFVAEVDPIQGKQYDITLRNYKSTVYA